MTAALEKAPLPVNDPYPSRVSNSPQRIPRREPVLYGAWHARAPLSRADAGLYDEIGYLHLQSVFTPAEIADLHSAADGLRQSAGGAETEGVILERNTKEVRSVFQVHDTHPLFARLAADERLVRIARFLLDDDVYVHQSRVNLKPAFVGRDFYWHSDFETWHVEDGMPAMRAVSMSISLSKTTEFNGPLMLMPRSQTEFVSCVGATPEDHYKKSLKRQEYGTPDADSLRRFAERGGIVSAKGAAGAVTIFDCNMMHGSNNNITPYERINVFIVYNACSNSLASPFCGRSPRPEFLAARANTQRITPACGVFA